MGKTTVEIPFLKGTAIVTYDPQARRCEFLRTQGVDEMRHGSEEERLEREQWLKDLKPWMRRVMGEHVLLRDVKIVEYEREIKNHLLMEDVSPLQWQAFRRMLVDINHQFSGLRGLSGWVKVREAQDAYRNCDPDSAQAVKLNDRIAPLVKAVEDFYRERHSIDLTQDSDARAQLQTALRTAYMEMVAQDRKCRIEFDRSNARYKPLLDAAETFYQERNNIALSDDRDDLRQAMREAYGFIKSQLPSFMRPVSPPPGRD